MNLETDSLYIVAKNDRALLERIFQGMFVVARRVLGYSPRGSSYPFTTAARWEGNGDFVQDKAFYDGKDAIDLCVEDYPHKNTKGRDNNKYHVFVTMTETNETSQNGIIRQLLTEAGEIDVNNVNTNTLAKELFKDYFQDMVAFARTSQTYAKDWQRIATNEAA